MTLSLNNRNRIALLLFFLLDHCAWLYGGHLEQAAFFYVVLSECVRILALLAVLASFFTPRYLTTSITLLMAYCAIMMLLNLYGSYDKLFYQAPIPNIFWFKKYRTVPVAHGLLAAIFYMYFLLFSYFFAAKHALLPTKDKKQQRHFNMPLL